MALKLPLMAPITSNGAKSKCDLRAPGGSQGYELSRLTCPEPGTPGAIQSLRRLFQTILLNLCLFWRLFASNGVAIQYLRGGSHFLWCILPLMVYLFNALGWETIPLAPIASDGARTQCLRVGNHFLWRLLPLMAQVCF